MPKKVTNATIKKAVNAYKMHDGNKSAAAAHLGIPKSTLSTRLQIAERRKIKADGNIAVKEIKSADPTHNRILELERKLTVAQDQNKALQAKLKAQHREESLFIALSEEMHQIIKPLKPLPTQVLKPKKSKHVEPLVLHLSDEHADQVVMPHRVGYVEEFNFRVALARAERLVEKTISLSKDTLSNYEFPELWVLAYGDHVNGEIHDGTSHSEFKNAFDNTIACGQMHALMLRDLAPHFPKIRILYLSGNHGRRAIRKDYHGALNNWDYLVGRTAEMLCQDIPNIEFLIPDSFSYTFEINGYNFCAFHGDDIKSWNSIPHYGIERKTRRLTAVHSAQGKQIHYFVMGHFHSRSNVEIPTGEVLINGAWKATDEYAYEQLGVICKPSQILHGVGAHGISFRMPIYLKFDGDNKGPKRYTAPLETIGHLGQLPKK